MLLEIWNKINSREDIKDMKISWYVKKFGESHVQPSRYEILKHSEARRTIRTGRIHTPLTHSPPWWKTGQWQELCTADREWLRLIQLHESSETGWKKHSWKRESCSSARSNASWWGSTALNRSREGAAWETRATPASMKCHALEETVFPWLSNGNGVGMPAL